MATEIEFKIKKLSKRWDDSESQITVVDDPSEKHINSLARSIAITNRAVVRWHYVGWSQQFHYVTPDGREEREFNDR